MACAETVLTSAYIDGELDDAAALQAERHIEACADCQALVAVAADLSETMRAPSARLQAPPLLKARIRRRLAKETGAGAPRPGFWWGALGGASISGLAASLVVGLVLPPAPEALTGALADAHIKALTGGHTIQVVSSSHHTVKPWFAGRTPLAPPVGDFAAEGFPLVGGRVDTVLGRPAAVVVYGHGLHEIDLFVWADRGGAMPASTDRLGYHTVFWRRGDLALAAVSDLGSDEMAKFVRLAQSQRE